MNQGLSGYADKASPGTLACGGRSFAWVRRIGNADVGGVAGDFGHPETFALLYMIVIVLVSMTGNIAAGIGLAIIAALCLNYFFTEPRFSLRIEATEDAV